MNTSKPTSHLAFKLGAIATYDRALEMPTCKVYGAVLRTAEDAEFILEPEKFALYLVELAGPWEQTVQLAEDGTPTLTEPAKLLRRWGTCLRGHYLERVDTPFFPCSAPRWLHPEKGELVLCREHGLEVEAGLCKAPPLRKNRDYECSPRKTYLVDDLHEGHHSLTVPFMSKTTSEIAALGLPRRAEFVATYTLLIWEEIPEDLRVYMIPDSDLEAAKVLTAASGGYVNGKLATKAQEKALAKVMNATFKPSSDVEEHPWRFRFEPHRVEASATEFPTKRTISRVIRCGFLL